MDGAQRKMLMIFFAVVLLPASPQLSRRPSESALDVPARPTDNCDAFSNRKEAP